MTHLDNFAAARQAMDAAKRIVIISHKNPDADAVGANLALREALENRGKEVVSACIDPIQERCKFLRKAETYVQEFDPAQFDLIITVDCGGYELVSFDVKGLNVLNIDHHPSNNNFGAVNVVMSEAAATCFVLFLMFTSYGWDITKSMATAMLHGLYFDTGSFMHSNTTPETLRVAARLKAIGGDHELCVKQQFKTKSLEKLRIWGHAFSKLDFNSKQALVSALTEEDFRKTNAQLEDLSGLINYLTHVPDARFGMLLTEDMKGNVKGSLRTQNDDVDLSQLAQLFGGGGHKKAAGFTIPGRLTEKVTWQIT